MPEDHRGIPVVLDMLVKLNAIPGCRSEHARQNGLALLDRIAAQVVAVQFYQLEGVQGSMRAVAPITNEIERCNARRFGRPQLCRLESCMQ